MQFLKIGFLFLLFIRLAINLRGTGSGKYHRFEWSGEHFEVNVRRTKGNVTGISLRLAIPDSWRFILRRETWFDRFAKNLGIASEWQTGDSGFDQRVFILSEDVTLNRALSRDRELREACLRAMAHRGAEIECKAGMLYCDFGFSPGSADKNLHKEIEKIGPLFTKELAAMIEVRNALRRIHSSRWHEERDPALSRKAWLVGISMVLACIGGLCLFFDLGADQHQVVREAIPQVATLVTVVVAASLLFTTFMWLRSTPHTHAVLLDILLAATPGCWMATSVAATVYNEKFDRSPAEQVPVQVEGAVMYKGKSRSYYLNVVQWPDPRGDHRVRITQDEYEWLQHASCVTVTWRHGQLGDGWVSAYREGCNQEAQVEK